MESKSSQEGLVDIESQLEKQRRIIRRADGGLYLIAIIAGIVFISLPGIRESTNFVVALSIIAFASISTVAVFLFPWHRYHPDLFVVIGILAIAQISTFIWATGGQLISFHLFYFFVVVAASAYHRTLWPIALIIGLSVLGAAGLLVYSHPLDIEIVGFLSVLVGVFITIAIITTVFFSNLARIAEQLEKRVQELTALNKMFFVGKEFVSADGSQYVRFIDTNHLEINWYKGISSNLSEYYLEKDEIRLPLNIMGLVQISYIKIIDSQTLEHTLPFPFSEQKVTYYLKK